MAQEPHCRAYGRASIYPGEGCRIADKLLSRGTLWEKHLQPFTGSGDAGSSKHLMLAVQRRVASMERIMFKGRAAGQRIFPSEPATPSLPSPVPEGSAAPSSAADLAYLDGDGAPHEGEQPLMISASRLNPSVVPSFAKSGFLFRRLSIKH